MSTREGFSQFSLSWWLCAHSKLGRTKSARKLPKQKHSPPFCFQFLPLDVTGKTQKFQDKFESDLFGRFWGHMYTHDIRTIWKLIVINVPIVISWTFLVTPHSFRVLITIERGIAVSDFWKKTCRIVSAEVVLLAVVDKRELAHSVSKKKEYFSSTLVYCKENEMVFVSQ